MSRAEQADPSAVARADAAPDDVEAQKAAADAELAAGQVRGGVRPAREDGAAHRRARTATPPASTSSGCSSCSRRDDPRVTAARRALARALY